MVEIESFPYTVADIIDMTGISERTVRRHLRQGLLKGTKVGGSWRFTEENIKDYFNAKTMETKLYDQAIQDVMNFLSESIERNKQRICSVIHFEPKDKAGENEAKKAIMELANSHSDMTMKMTKKHGVLRFTLIGGYDFILACSERLNELRA
ncbi:MAG: helix-turn-helix domain-containing protein [Bacillota bacterium]